MVNVRIGHHHVEGFLHTVSVGDAVLGAPSLLDEINGLHGRREPKFASQFFVQLNQGPDQSVRSTLGEIDAPFSFKEVNQGVDG